jgi:uncharacterized membrane protein
MHYIQNVSSEQSQSSDTEIINPQYSDSTFLNKETEDEKTLEHSDNQQDSTKVVSSTKKQNEDLSLDSVKELSSLVHKKLSYSNRITTISLVFSCFLLSIIVILAILRPKNIDLDFAGSLVNISLKRVGFRYVIEIDNATLTKAVISHIKNNLINAVVFVVKSPLAVFFVALLLVLLFNIIAGICRFIGIYDRQSMEAVICLGIMLCIFSYMHDSIKQYLPDNKNK